MGLLLSGDIRNISTLFIKERCAGNVTTIPRVDSYCFADKTTNVRTNKCTALLTIYVRYLSVDFKDFLLLRQHSEHACAVSYPREMNLPRLRILTQTSNYTTFKNLFLLLVGVRTYEYHGKVHVPGIYNTGNIPRLV